MGLRIKTLNKLVAFFKNVAIRASSIVLDLNYLKYEIEFGERDDDIFVATYLRSGTTWMQMILYQLTTDGNMDFGHIYDVSPWLRNLSAREGKLPELPSPRIIKMHDPYHKVMAGKKGRFIFVIREGRDMAHSLWHHHRNYNNSKLTEEENFDLTFRDKNDMNWFDFTEAWLTNKNGHNILYVRYEDLQANLAGQIERIAQFLGITVQPEQMQRVLERSSFAFMKQHEEKFGEQPPEEKHDIVYNQFIRSGRTGEGRNSLSEADQQFFKEQFEQRLAKFDLVKPYTAALPANK